MLILLGALECLRKSLQSIAFNKISLLNIIIASYCKDRMELSVECVCRLPLFGKYQCLEIRCLSVIDCCIYCKVSVSLRGKHIDCDLTITSKLS